MVGRDVAREPSAINYGSLSSSTNHPRPAKGGTGLVAPLAPHLSPLLKNEERKFSALFCFCLCFPPYQNFSSVRLCGRLCLCGHLSRVLCPLRHL